MDGQDATMTTGTPPAVDPSGLPDRGFACVAVRPRVRLWHAEGVVRGLSRYEEGYVLGTTPLVDMGFGNLHTYMHRRFGPPFMAGDPLKDITAGWLLATPDPDVFLKVSPSLSGPDFSLSPLIPPEAGRNLPPEEVTEERQAAILAAYRTAAMDLLRPVRVRDSSFNVMGAVGDDDPLVAWTEDGPEEREHYTVEAHPSCGYSMPMGLLGSAGFGDVAVLLARLGDGDTVRGAEAAVPLLRAALMRELRSKPAEVRVLMAARAIGQADEAFMESLALSPGERAEAEAISPALTGREFGDFPDHGDEHARAAEALVDAFGIKGEIRRPLRQVREIRRINAEYALMWEAAGPELPDEVLPLVPRSSFGILGRTEIEAFVSKLHAHATPAAGAWGDRLLAEPGGEDVLHRILDHLIRKNPAAAKALAEAEEGDLDGPDGEDSSPPGP